MQLWRRRYGQRAGKSSTLKHEEENIAGFEKYQIRLGVVI
jgi:hypothetical protein